MGSEEEVLRDEALAAREVEVEVGGSGTRVEDCTSRTEAASWRELVIVAMRVEDRVA